MTLHDILHRLIEVASLSPGEREELHDNVSKLAAGAESAAGDVVKEAAETLAEDVAHAAGI